jgi:EAL domain-containing protein (putative c-di-GMP-specific phosphodiesterase class I)
MLAAPRAAYKRPNGNKIDRYFVDGVENDPYHLAVLKCVSDLARNVGARVVAEGVESDASLRAVIESQICLVQGNLFAQPLPLEKLRVHPLVRPARGAG